MKKLINVESKYKQNDYHFTHDLSLVSLILCMIEELIVNESLCELSCWWRRKIKVLYRMHFIDLPGSNNTDGAV
jgi:hypothetical protein